MRRLTALLLLITMLCPLAAQAEGAIPTGLAGRWETSAEETLCATMLYIMYNGQYRLISEGMTSEGVCRLEGDTLILESHDGHIISCGCHITPASPLERTITLSDDLRLYPCIDVEFQWLNFASPGYTGHFSLMLLDDNRFMLHYYFIGDTHPELPEGSASMIIEDTTYLMAIGTWLAYDTHLLLTTVFGDTWELALDPETGLPTGTENLHFIP
ncbi:MAG: hypothetical protein IKK57_08705 [Clostridia bacterium]|nr:hypothetical protein [Clostridia bacterium]